MARSESGTTAREVWESAVACIKVYDVDRYVEHFSPSAVLEFPFASATALPRRVMGRDAIRDLLGTFARAAKAAGRKTSGFDHLVVHETNDPEVIVVEFDLHGSDASGATYELSYVHVVRVQEGLITSMRDYFDSGALSKRIQAVAPPAS